MEDELMQQVLEAHRRSFQRAFEIAVRTGTALVYSRDGEIVHIRPPYRYVLVPISPEEMEQGSDGDGEGANGYRS